MYDIMDYLFIARCMGYNAIHRLRSLVLRSRDEPSPKCQFLTGTLILHVSYSWTLIFDVTGSHAENL